MLFIMIDDLDKKIPPERKSECCSDFCVRAIYNLELNIAGWRFGDFDNLLINNHYTIHFNQCILR